MLAHTESRVGVAGYDQSRLDDPGPKETVDDLQCGQYPALAVGDVERERTVLTGMWIVEIRTDHLLDQRRQRGSPRFLSR